MNVIDWRREWKILALIAGRFMACFYLPVGSARFDTAVLESLRLVKWYAREHVLLCLVPAWSLPSMLVIRSVLVTKKTAVFVLLVMVMATLSGMVLGEMA